MLEKLLIGTDIVEINRFRQLPHIKNKKFYNKIFTESEITNCNKYKDPYPHFAMRFAGKEAVIKTIKNKIEMKDIEIGYKKSKPFVIILKKKLFVCHISLSHDREYAIAMIISENN
jgi:holo-[acyl-carrier protein] synthase|tara:strand:- start:416 stop:763 length:348 start_codon:yes stop_codon:yes gene_type:complete